MFKIGDFSKLSRVSVKTLRYYDEIGLLKPHGIDRFTRYRFYSLEQLPVLYRILALKELGFSLDQVARLLEGDLTPDQLRKMLQKRQAEIEQDLAAAQDQLAQVQARLRQIEQDGCLPHYEVLLKQVDAQIVAAVDGLLPGYDQAEAVFNRLFTHLFAWLERHELKPAGPPLALYHEAVYPEEGTRLEAAAPLARQIPGN
jgi:DNA-binding transcriptional MerR regulator